MSTEVNSWPVDEMGSTLNEDFDTNFNSIGMEITTNPFNMNETLLALPTLKNEQSVYETKFATNQEQSISNLNNNLNSFNENNLNSNLQNLSNMEMNKNLSKLSMNNQTISNRTMNNQPMNNQTINNQSVNNQSIINQPINSQQINSQPINNQSVNSQSIINQPINSQPIISQPINNQNLNTQNMNNRNMNNQNMNNLEIKSKNDANGSLTNQSNGLKQNTVLSKFSNNKSNLNELSKLELIEIKQNFQQQQKNNMCLNSTVHNLKRSSPVDSPINLMEMQQNSPHCTSENSSVKSSISPGTSLSSSPIHYSTGYSNVHMLRNSILNEPTNSINQSQTSTIPLTSLSSSFLSNANSNGLSFFQDKDDGRPIAIVQGKKNRHNLNDDDDEETVGTIKKFCVNNVNNSSSNNETGTNQLQSNLNQLNNSSPNQSTFNSNVNDFRYLMQSHSFTCNLGNNLTNNLQNSLNNSLTCGQINTSNNTGNSNNQDQPNQQQTDNANLFSTACCGNDCKSATVAQQEYRCVGQRHSNDFSCLYYHPNRLTAASPCTSVTNAPYQFFSQSNQFLTDSSANQLIQTQQSQNSPFFLQHRNGNMYRTHTTHFQYILSANTSMASKVHEETMTYLNQGQSYEIKLKKISGLELQGNILKSVIRVGFQERRLQYMEKDLLQQWKQQRSSERILEVDIPLSYGVFEIIHPNEEINKVEFAWDPSNVNKDSGIFIKLNAISTEFTPKKHGGEKGVPFRLIIETHMYSNNSPISLNTFIEGASCQVKVFKPKGADRKHKTDREKMAKRSVHEQQKYLPSYDCTMFKPCTVEALFLNNTNNSSNQANNLNDTNGQVNNFNFNGNLANNSSTSGNIESTNENSNGENQTDLSLNPTLFNNQDEDCKSNIFLTNNQSSSLNSNIDSSDNSSNSNNNLQCNNLNNSLTNMINFCSSQCASPFNPMNNVIFSNNNPFINSPLAPNLDSTRVREWLLANRFEKYFSLFHMFSSNDLLNLSREDLIQICNLTDGIRLYNCLHIKASQPKITIYLSFETDGLFRAIYLSTFKFDEFREKLLRLVCENNNNYNYNVLSSKLNNVLMIGPKKDIKVLITEEVISNLEKESMYVLRIEKDANSDKYDLILKPYK